MPIFKRNLWVIGPMFFVASMLFLKVAFAGNDTIKGEIVYQTHCMSCHGVNGDGNGPDAESLNPKPTDFTSSAAMSQLKYPDIERAIVIGKQGTGMEGFGNIINQEEVRAVINFIINFSAVSP